MRQRASHDAPAGPGQGPGLPEPERWDVTRFAVLPMYDFPPLRAAHADFWAAVASRAGIDAALRQGGVFAFTDPELVMAQTCGLPLTTTLAPLGLVVVATPCYRAPGCRGPTHRSVVVHARR